MTQWSDGRPAGAGPSGPPPYGPSFAPPAGQGYGPPGPGGYGSPYGPGARPPRETGALVVCVVLLVLAVIAGFVASAAVSSSLDGDSAAAPVVSPQPAYGGAGPVATGGGVGVSGGAGASPGPGASRSALKRDFPVYPGARRVYSTRQYLASGQIVENRGVHYFAPKSVDSVFRWYGKHLGHDHLKYGYLSKTVYEGTNTVAYLFGSVDTVSDGNVFAEFDLQPGRRRGSCVVTVNFYG